MIGADGVKALKLMGLEAVEIVRRRVEQYAIDCDLRWGYCDLANKPGDYQGFREDMEELQALGYRHGCAWCRPRRCAAWSPDRYVGGLVDMGSGHLHPLNLVLGEACRCQSLGVRLFERSPVTRIDYGTEVQVHTATGKVRAKTLVLGCNAYMNDLNPLLGGKVLPAGSYVIATEPLDETGPPTAAAEHGGVRPARGPRLLPLSADNRLLFGGACHYYGRDLTSPPTCGRRCWYSRNWRTSHRLPMGRHDRHRRQSPATDRPPAGAQRGASPRPIPDTG